MHPVVVAVRTSIPIMMHTFCLCGSFVLFSPNVTAIYVGIRGNSAADFAAKDALDGDISNELIPFSDLKARLNNYIVELRQRECDEYSKK